MRKILLIIMTITMLLAFSTTALADDTSSASSRLIPTPMFADISSVACGLNINASGKASCAASIVAYSYVDSVRISMYLQRSSGGGWTSINHWEVERNDFIASLDKEYYVTSGYDYRILVYFYATDNGSTESTSLTSYESY